MIKDLKDIRRDEVSLFGGKATNLGFLIQNGFNVPEGFCISTKINELIPEIREEIIHRYKKLNSPVSVRSSGTCEDSEKASFAGQFDTFLNVKTEKDLFTAIKKCQQSVKGERVIAYMKDRGIKEVRMAVIVQKMIDAEHAGVCFTIDPIDKKDILIEVVKGLGEKLVSGQITPNSYFVNRKKQKIEKKTESFEFSDDLIRELREIALRIESAYSLPQDIEFAVKNEKIFILQSRAITT